MADKPLILIVDDDTTLLPIMEARINPLGFRTQTAVNRAALMEAMNREIPTIILLDLKLGNHDGSQILQELVAQYPALPVILFTGNATVESAVNAMKMGAFDYLVKPVDPSRLRVTLKHAMEKVQLQKRLENLEDMVRNHQARGTQMVGDSPPIRLVREMIATVAQTDATVLILGESGTGKEVTARMLHEQSRRSAGPFVPVNMAALPRDLVESTLFGHEKGSFTGAEGAQVGCCEAADQGTLFLDEIGEMDLGLQAKLLRFLQEKTVQRVGSTRAKVVDVRVVAATNLDLEEQSRQGKFREDLYYRLNVVPIKLPPLRDRREDIGALAQRFLLEFALRYRRNIQGFTPEALDALSQNPWPGNVRQLQNLMERLAILGKSPWIGLAELPADFHARKPGSAIMQAPAAPPISTPTNLPAPTLLPAEAPPVPVVSEGPGTPPSGTGFIPLMDADANLAKPFAKTQPAGSMEDLEKNAIKDALIKSGGNAREAAQALGIGVATIYRKLKKYGIEP